MSTDTATYGIRWDNGYIEPAGFSRALAECLGGLALRDGDATLIASRDGGWTWEEVSDGDS